MKKLLFLFSLLMPWLAAAQIAQTARFEKEHKGSDLEHIVIAMGEKGLTLVRNTEKFEQRKKVWDIIVLDTALHETWAVKVNIDQYFNILGHDYRDGNVYLVFHESNNPKGTLKIMEVDLRTHNIAEHDFKPEVEITFSHFSVMNGIAIFGGYITKEPAILLYDMQHESAKVLPGTFAPHMELLDLRTNVNNTFNALLTERRSKREKKLIVRTYNANGVILIDDEILVDDDKTILSGLTSTLINDDLIIIGTWTEGSSGTQATGIYSVVVDPFKDQKINYWDFTGLKHFLDYLPAKKAERIRAKAEWRRNAGKSVDFKAHVASIKIEESKEGFSFLSEVYTPSNNYGNNRWSNPYSNPYYSPYYNPYSFSPYSFGPMPYRYYSPFYGPYSPYGPSTVSNDTRIQHATILFFDLKGKLKDDLGLKFEEIKMPTREQVSDYIVRNNVTTFACLQEKEIQIQQTSADGSEIRNEKFKIDTGNPNDEIKSESNSSTVRIWYKNNFYIFGYHTLKDKTEHKSRDVFYINRLTIE
jgi:hypothetical protein